MNKANLYVPAIIDLLLLPAVVNKNNLHTSCLSMYVLTKNLQLSLFLKDFINLFLALLFRHHAKDQDTLVQE